MDKIEGDRREDSFNQEGLRSYQPLELFFLLRFARLQGLKEGLKASVRTDWRANLIDKALYSTYRDCEALGLATDAQTFQVKKGMNN